MVVRVVVACVPLGLCLTGAEAAAASGWAIQAVPKPALPSGQLSAVSCVSGLACAAVGSFTNGTGTQALLAERWNGAGWSVQSTPNPSGTKASALNGVSCVSGSACIAVGSFTTGGGTQVMLAERWNGARWSVQRSPNAAAARSSSLSGVSCASRKVCIAVGSFTNRSRHQVPLVERWNGSRWSIQRIPIPAGASELNGVSCSSSAACTAVGSRGPGALVERWNGATWSIQRLPSPRDATLSGVSCTSRTVCIAVGYSYSSAGQVTLAESWNGTDWKVQTTPGPACNAQLGCSTTLNGVSCPSRSACTAVGASVGAISSNGESTVWVAERWNGSRWSIQSPASPDNCQDTQSGACSNGLVGVSCPSRTVCTAVGGFGEVTLAKRWNGAKWSTQSTPNPPGPAAGIYLNGVSCTSATTCTAVGSSTDGMGNAVTLAERWNGSGWAIQPTPNPNGGRDQLNGVSCASATACTAVGGGDNGPFAEVWNGSTWTIRSTPKGPSGATLNAGSCTSATACIAVGYGPFAEVWNGSTWTIQSAPYPTWAILNAVSCTSATACIAVGYGPDGSLAEVWNGSSWTIGSPPNPTGALGHLTGVSCVSATACTAVGSFTNGPSAPRTLAEVWDGSSWTMQNTPNPATDSQLNGVSCTSATDCVSVGSFYNSGAGLQVTLAEAWDGTSWTIQNTPTGADGRLNGVSCTSATACIAVAATFAERYS